MRWLFEPRLTNEAFGDPGLYVDFRDERRAMLFDVGDIDALPPRKLMRLSHVFVTHTHMDHFAGFDRLLAIVLGRKQRLTLVGGPDFIAKVEHKLHAYTWNVVYRYDELVLDVCEIGLDGRGECARFSTRTNFVRESTASFALDSDVVHDEATFRVRARFVDHDVPCLAYAIERRRTCMSRRIASTRSASRPARGFASSSMRCFRVRRMQRRSTCAGAIAAAITR